jgi:hypothetical protein
MRPRTIDYVPLHIHNGTIRVGTRKQWVEARKIIFEIPGQKEGGSQKKDRHQKKHQDQVRCRLVPNIRMPAAPKAEIFQPGKTTLCGANGKKCDIKPESFETRGNGSVSLIGKGYGADGQPHQYRIPPGVVFLADGRRVIKIMPAKGSRVPGTSADALGIMYKLG